MRVDVAGRIQRRQSGASAIEPRLRLAAGALVLALFLIASVQLVVKDSAAPVFVLVVATGLGAYLLLIPSLTATEAKYQAVFESAAVGIARVGLDGGWLEVNQAYCDILGYTRRELLSHTFQDMTHPDDLARDVDQVERLLAGKGRSFTVEKRYIRKGGARIWVELVVSLVRSPDGKPSYFVASVIDISARKAAELARDEARQFAEDLAFVSPALLYVYDIQANRTVYASRETGEMLGRRAGEVQALELHELTGLVHEDDLPCAAAQLAHVRSLADGESCECELRIKHADGNWRWLLVRNAVFRRDAQGNVTQTVGSALDITARAKSEHAAREARALIDALFVQAPIGLAYFDRSLRNVLVNGVAAQLAGLSVDELVGRSIEEILPREKGRDIADDMRRVIETGLPTTGLIVADETRPPPSALRDIVVSYYPVRVTGAGVVGVGCITQDVTEQRRIEREGEKLVVELREAVRARDDFLSIASHELRTPLTTLTLGAEHLVRLVDGAALPSREQLRMRADRLQKQGRRLERLVAMLLDVARITQGRIELFREEIDVAAVVADQVERLAETASTSGSRITVEAGGPILGRFDRTRLEQIVDGLVWNAIKFGCGKPIRVSLDASQESIRLTVRDEGLGIAKEDRARIFERFEQAVSKRHYGGLGLGLWVTRQIVEAMGGTVSVSGELGQGSTFVVELPRNP